MKEKNFDYIISGAGCAGLSLLMHMIHSGKFGDKRILLIDKNPKQSNDRTWCFWEKGAGLFEPVVYKNWDKLWFHGEEFSQQLEIGPYQYKMIRGIDFYTHCFGIIRQQKNIEILFEPVGSVFSGAQTGVRAGGTVIQAEYVFNSILFNQPPLTHKEFWLLQHFKGWVIETDEDRFHDHSATLMDFRVDQAAGTTFCYVLPFSPRRALVEYTVFSEKIFQQDQYDEALGKYIEGVLNISTYAVVEKEFGVIPMTNVRFSNRDHHIINIGTAGGQTKGSSGYTFHFIQKHSRAIVQQLIAEGHPFVPAPAKRFHFYDSVLLNILSRDVLPGKKIFTDLFQKNPVGHVLRFLDNESTLREEWKIISSLPTIPFLKAGIQQVF